MLLLLLPPLTNSVTDKRAVRASRSVSVCRRCRALSRAIARGERPLTSLHVRQLDRLSSPVSLYSFSPSSSSPPLSGSTSFFCCQLLILYCATYVTHAAGVASYIYSLTPIGAASGGKIASTCTSGIKKLHWSNTLYIFTFLFVADTRAGARVTHSPTHARARDRYILYILSGFWAIVRRCNITKNYLEHFQFHCSSLGSHNHSRRASILDATHI